MLVISSLHSFPFDDDECQQNPHRLFFIYQELIVKNTISILQDVDLKRKLNELLLLNID